MSRPDGRTLTQPRPVEILPGFHHNAEGSVLYRAGSTVVLCTASVERIVPTWMAGKGEGWLTAEYQMHPRASLSGRQERDGRGKALSGRSQEIQRLIGRSLRAALDLKLLGERMITIDCDVLEADGGTRTASITGGFVAMVLALARLTASGTLAAPVLRDQVAAISVGYLHHGLALDPCYTEDRAARVDLNVVATARGSIVEVQATAEGEAITRNDLDKMLDLGLSGVAWLLGLQRDALANAGVELERLFQDGRGTAPWPRPT